MMYSFGWSGTASPLCPQIALDTGGETHDLAHMIDTPSSSHSGGSELIDEAYHYPADFLQLLIDTIPLLNRSKKDVLLFFKGAGVPADDYADIEAELSADSASHNKYGITRIVLTRLNDRGDNGLAPRREVVKRIVEFEDLSTLWENDRMRAKGQIASVRERVNTHDSFTRMAIERNKELERHRANHEAQQLAAKQRAGAIEAATAKLFALFGETNPQRRGKEVEGALNDVFAAHGISVRQAFTRNGDGGEGVIEQVDGAIEFDGHTYLVEMKWYAGPIGVGEVSQHLVRVMNRGGGVRGLIIANPGYSDAAITTVREALGTMTVFLITLQDIVMALTRHDDLVELLRSRVHAATIERQPYVPRS